MGIVSEYTVDYNAPVANRQNNLLICNLNWSQKWKNENDTQ